MPNGYYNHGGYPATNSVAASAGLRNELSQVSAGFDKLPSLLDGIAGQIAFVNAASTAIVTNANLLFLNNTLTVPNIAGNGAALTGLNASNLTSGTIPEARFPASLPSLSGANITNLNASNLASGIVPDARFPATLPAISGANLTNLNASNLASGTVPSARLTGSYAISITGNAATASNADLLDNIDSTNFLRVSTNSSSPLNGNFAIGTSGGRNFIQSHGGAPLDINPLGNSVVVNGSGLVLNNGGTYSINITGNAATASNGGVTSVNGRTGAVSVSENIVTATGGAAPYYAARAWVNFNGTNGTIRASANVTSITRNAVGSYNINFSTAMSDTNYVINANHETEVNVAFGFIGALASGFGTTTVRIHTLTNSGGSLFDRTFITVAFFR